MTTDPLSEVWPSVSAGRGTVIHNVEVRVVALQGRTASIQLDSATVRVRG
jgi:hypothetical protein